MSVYRTHSRSRRPPRYLYNDASYLAEQLSRLSSRWRDRRDLAPSTRNLLRLDPDIKALEAFANRSYGNELALQKTVLRELVAV